MGRSSEAKSFNTNTHHHHQRTTKHSLQEVYIDMFDQLDEALQEALQQQVDKFNVGIDIIQIRVTKPKIPPEIERN